MPTGRLEINILVAISCRPELSLKIKTFFYHNSETILADAVDGAPLRMRFHKLRRGHPGVLFERSIKNRFAVETCLIQDLKNRPVFGLVVD